MSLKLTCEVLEHPQGAQPYVPTVRADKGLQLAYRYKRYSFRMIITGMLYRGDWPARNDQGSRIWRKKRLSCGSPKDMTSSELEKPRALRGVRILDLSRLVAGNVLTHTLADFGAEVIKVEPPQGDPLRAWRVKGIPTYWNVYCRNKKSVALDLRKARARDLLLRLVEHADVFVENFRPGTLERMELAPQTLLARNPNLVVARISGWGQTGPYRERPGFGTLVEGYCGFAAINGFPDREPVLPPIQLADSVAGLFGAIGVLTALRHRESNGGAGQVIDLSLFEPLFAMLGPQAANYQITGKVKARSGSRSTTAGPRNVYKTKDDKWICLSASMQNMAERLFLAIGRPDLIHNARYASNADRVKHGQELDAIIGDFVCKRTLLENLSLFGEADVTVGPVYDIAQLVLDPYVRERGVLQEFGDSTTGRFMMHAVAPRLSETPGVIRTFAPTIGQHNAELLEEIGVDAAAFQDLVREGVVRTEA